MRKLKTALVCVCVSFVWEGSAVPETTTTCDVRVEGSHATFTTERMIAEVDDGVITRIFNRLTTNDR
jgi:hypothetical protein